MLITAISEKNVSAFRHLISPEVRTLLFSEGVFALGAICEEKGEKLAAGVLIFSVDEGESGDEILMAAVIRWLFVSEEMRQKGVADRLMAELIHAVGLGGVEHIICDLPVPEEYDALCGYLESLGFEFSLAELPVLDTTLEALLSLPALQKAPLSDACEPLLAIDSARFARLINKIRKLPAVSERLSVKKEYYDGSISCVCSDDKGAMLLTSDPELGLELLYMGAFDQAQRRMGEMAAFSVNAARGKYSPDTPLRISCRTEAGAATVARLFAGAQPRLVRRGYMSIYDFLKEAEQ